MAQKTKIQAKTKVQKPAAVAPKKAVHAPAVAKKADTSAAQRSAKPAAAAIPAAVKGVKKPVTVKVAVAKAVPAKPNIVQKKADAKPVAAAAAKPAAPAPKAGIMPQAQRPASAATVNKFKAASAALAKSGAAPKITAPMAAPATPKAIAEKAAAAARQAMTAQAAAQKKPVSQRHGFKTNEFVVYPAHGVGRIIGIEEQEIAGMALELFVINFEKEKLTLRVPTGKLASVGMRKLAEDGVVKKAMETLKGRARVKRTMWSRRAQEYVAKINSGDLVSIAEVVRDLYRSEAQPEQSYSERQLYEDALDRMSREIAAVEKLDSRGAVQRITEILSKSARGRRLAEEGNAQAA